MRLVFSAKGGYGPPPAAEAVLQRAFDVIQTSLGLSGRNEDVEVLFWEKTNGAANIDNRYRFPIRINIGMRVHECLAGIVFSLAHEMVHARDAVQGRLVIRPPHGIEYDGVLTPASVLRRCINDRALSMKLPHEVEPYALAPKLAAKVFQKLPPADLKALAFGLTWLEVLYDASDIRQELIKYAEAA